jgi:hypothetical protein
MPFGKVVCSFTFLSNFDPLATWQVYRGEDCPIIMRKEYFVRFTCDFDLSMYPFDANICSMEFEVSGIRKDYVRSAI